MLRLVGGGNAALLSPIHESEELFLLLLLDKLAFHSLQIPFHMIFCFD